VDWVILQCFSADGFQCHGKYEFGATLKKFVLYQFGNYRWHGLLVLLVFVARQCICTGRACSIFCFVLENDANTYIAIVFFEMIIFDQIEFVFCVVLMDSVDHVCLFFVTLGVRVM